MADKDAAHSMPDLSVFETEIRKTGFVLESRITRILPESELERNQQQVLRR